MDYYNFTHFILFLNISQHQLFESRTKRDNRNQPKLRTIVNIRLNSDALQMLIFSVYMKGIIIFNLFKLMYF